MDCGAGLCPTSLDQSCFVRMSKLRTNVTKIACLTILAVKQPRVRKAGVPFDVKGRFWTKKGENIECVTVDITSLARYRILHTTSKNYLSSRTVVIAIMEGEHRAGA